MVVKAVTNVYDYLLNTSLPLLTTSCTNIYYFLMSAFSANKLFVAIFSDLISRIRNLSDICTFYFVTQHFQVLTYHSFESKNWFSYTLINSLGGNRSFYINLSTTARTKRVHIIVEIKQYWRLIQCDKKDYATIWLTQTNKVRPILKCFDSSLSHL